MYIYICVYVRNTWKFPQRRCSFTFCTQRLSTFYPFSSKPTGYTGSKWQSYITLIYFILFHTTVILLEIAFLCEILVLYLRLCYAHAGEVKNHQPTLRSRWTASPRCPGCQWVAKQDDSIVFSWLMKLWTSGHLVIPEHVRKKNAYQETFRKTPAGAIRRGGSVPVRRSQGSPTSALFRTEAIAQSARCSSEDNSPVSEHQSQCICFAKDGKQLDHLPSRLHVSFLNGNTSNSSAGDRAHLEILAGACKYWVNWSTTRKLQTSL